MNASRFRICLGLSGLAVFCVGFAGVLSNARSHGGDRTPVLIQNLHRDGFRITWQQPTGDGEVRLRGHGANDRPIAATRRGEWLEAEISGLQTGATYRYQMIARRDQGASRAIREGTVRTALPPGKPFSFIAFGDSGGGGRAQVRLAEVMARYPADLILHVGDIVYPDGDPADYPDRFFKPYRNLLGGIPFYPVLGNHDVQRDQGAFFLDLYSLPTNGPAQVEAERCYWMDYGDARFIAIDSTLESHVLAHDVAPWLLACLQQATQTWKIVYFHHSPWAGGRRSAEDRIQATLIPAIERGGADVVLTGHNHLYERTQPIRNGEISPDDGTVYITTGAGGKSLHPQRSDETRRAAYNDERFSFTWVTVGPMHLDIQQICDSDELVDHVTLTKTAARLGDR